MFSDESTEVIFHFQRYNQTSKGLHDTFFNNKLKTS